MWTLTSSANSNRMRPWATAVWVVWQRALWNQWRPSAYRLMVTAFVTTMVYSVKRSRTVRKSNIQKIGWHSATLGNSLAANPNTKSVSVVRSKSPPIGTVRPHPTGNQRNPSSPSRMTHRWSAGAVKRSIRCACGAHGHSIRFNSISSITAINKAHCPTQLVRRIFRAFCTQRMSRLPVKNCVCAKSFSSLQPHYKIFCAVIYNSTTRSIIWPTKLRYR